MKFGIREICDVVLKAKTAQKVGNRVFYKNEPVLYFDSLKTSSLEGASTTVYAQGGRGNARLIAWEGERTVTFTMEDALISPEGFSILTGAGLVQGEEKAIIMHTTEQTDKVTFYSSTTKVEHPTDAQLASTADSNNITSIEIELSEEPYFGQDNSWGAADVSTGISLATPTVQGNEDFMYVMVMKEGNIISEPFIPLETKLKKTSVGTYIVTIYKAEAATESLSDNEYETVSNTNHYRTNDLSDFYDNCVVFVDYYTKRTTGAYQVNITPDKFGGNYYLEASTLFRDTNGTDLPAEFIIPNCKIQSNFTFSMAASGDPSTFTFTMDAFPDYTRWDQTKKVFAAIQVFDVGEVGSNLDRLGTKHDNATVKTFYDTNHKPFIEL